MRVYRYVITICLPGTAPSFLRHSIYAADEEDIYIVSLQEDATLYSPIEAIAIIDALAEMQKYKKCRFDTIPIIKNSFL
jgi:hypothetical protein